MFDQLYKEEWLQAKNRMAFLLGLAYSVMGIFSAMVLFRRDPSMASVAFTALLILPTLHSLLSLETNRMAREARFSVARLLWDHWDILSIYFFLCAGVVVAFGFFAAMWPPVATSAIFAAQSTLSPGLASAGAPTQVFVQILTNNARVLFISLLLSVFYGAGSIFILVWMASSWGVVVGLAARVSAAGTGHPVFQFLYSLALLSPHMVFEAGSFFFAALAGGVVSKAVIRERFFTARFNRIMQDGLYLFMFAVAFTVIAAYMEAYVSPWLIAWIR